jgi:hypothetical protein
MGISVEMEVHLLACSDVGLYGAVRSSVHLLNPAIVGEAGDPGTSRGRIVANLRRTEEQLKHVSDAPGRARWASPTNAAGKAPAVLCHMP